MGLTVSWIVLKICTYFVCKLKEQFAPKSVCCFIENQPFWRPQSSFHLVYFQPFHEWEPILMHKCFYPLVMSLFHHLCWSLGLSLSPERVLHKSLLSFAACMKSTRPLGLCWELENTVLCFSPIYGGGLCWAHKCLLNVCVVQELSWEVLSCCWFLCFWVLKEALLEKSSPSWIICY